MIGDVQQPCLLSKHMTTICRLPRFYNVSHPGNLEVWGPGIGKPRGDSHKNGGFWPGGSSSREQIRIQAQEHVRSSAVLGLLCRLAHCASSRVATVRAVWSTFWIGRGSVSPRSHTPSLFKASLLLFPVFPILIKQVFPAAGTSGLFWSLHLIGTWQILVE